MATLLLVVGLFQAAISAQTGTLRGRILATDGTPAKGVRVTAMAVLEGTPTTSAGVHVSLAEADSDGRYRLENIPPGRYYVTAGFVNSPTYYPGVLTLSRATVVNVTAGSSIDDIDFAMLAPAGFKVTGRVVVPPQLPHTMPPLALTAYPTLIETTIGRDGTFEFIKVPSGSYTLTNRLGLPQLAVVVRDHDVENLEVGTGTSGVRVSGRLVVQGAGSSPVANATVSLVPSRGPDLTVLANPASNSTNGAVVTGGVVGGVLAAPIGVPVSAAAEPDGSFEFLRVPPGTYTLRALPAAGTQSMSLTVADKDITGIQVVVPFQAEVRVQAVMLDGSPMPASQVMIQARRANGGTSMPLQGGVVTLRLTEGEHQIFVSGLPLGYVVNSILADGVDLSRQQLRIAPGSVPNQIEVKLATVSVDSIQGVRVRGRVTGLPAGAVGARVALTPAEGGGSFVETTPNADGTFEFPKVPAGAYSARVTGFQYATVSPLQARFFVGQDDITGLQIPLIVRTPVSGAVIVKDAAGAVISGFPTGVSVSFRRGTGSSGTSIRPDGTFMIPLEEGDQFFNIDRLPSGYTIKSIVSGSVDLMKSPLKVEKNFTPPAIVVEMEFHPTR